LGAVLRDARPAGSINAFSAVRPEKTTQLDIGAQYKSDRFDAWVSAYAGYVQDYILFDYSTGMMGATTRATNVNAQIMGGEAGVSWRPVAPLRVETSLAYAWGATRRAAIRCRRCRRSTRASGSNTPVAPGRPVACGESLRRSIAMR
jgi:outer membrane receptor protein involved in Fe transport